MGRTLCGCAPLDQSKNRFLILKRILRPCNTTNGQIFFQLFFLSAERVFQKGSARFEIQRIHIQINELVIYDVTEIK